MASVDNEQPISQPQTPLFASLTMSDTSTAVLLAAVVALLLGTGIAMVGQAYEDTPTHVESIDNESVTVDYASYQPVSKSGASGVVDFYENESVYNSSDAKLTEGTDYEWNATDGTVLFKNTSATTEGESANISYAYDTRPKQATSMMAPLAAIFEIGGIFPLVFIAGAVFYAVGMLNSLGGGGRGGIRR